MNVHFGIKLAKKIIPANARPQVHGALIPVMYALITPGKISGPKANLKFLVPIARMLDALICVTIRDARCSSRF